MSIGLRCLLQGSEKPQFGLGKLVLYSNRLCPYAQRARLVLISKEIPHETVNVHLTKKPDWFKALTPKAQVPIIELNDGKVLHESIIISDYLNSVYPGKELHSDDQYRKAIDQILIGSIADFSSSLRYAIFKPEEADMHYIQAKLNQTLAFYETNFCERGTTFFGGTKPMMVDYMLWPFFERFDAYSSLFTDPEMAPKLPPNFAKWTIAMLDDHAVQETMLSTAVHVRYLESVIDGTFDYDAGLPECE